MQKTSLDMTQGDVLGGLLAFSAPALVGNFLHQIYSLTDSIVVGRVLGVEALAAVGCTMPIILLMSSALGLLLALFERHLTRIFLEDVSGDLLHISYQYLLITAVSGALAGLMFTYQQLLHGMGDTVASMRGGIVQLLSKVAFIAVGALAFRSLSVVWFAFIAVGALAFRSLSVVWFAWPVSFASAALYLLLHYRKIASKERIGAT